MSLQPFSSDNGFSTTGNVDVGNVNTGNINVTYVVVSGNISVSDIPASPAPSINGFENGNFTGNIYTAYFHGDGSNISNILGTSVNGAVGSANIVTDPNQTNITSVGTLTNLNVTGNVDTGNAQVSNLTVLGTTNLLGASIVGNLTPSTGNLYFLGTPASPWNGLYLGLGNITMRDQSNVANTVTLAASNGELLVQGVLGLQANLINGTTELTLSPSGNIDMAVDGGGVVFTAATDGIYLPGNVSANLFTTGSLTLTDGTLTNTDTNGNIGINTNGTGAVNITADSLQVRTTSNPNPIFDLQPSGEVLMYVPTFDADAGALNVIGSSDGNFLASTQAGAMIHVTGQDGAVSRIYNDGASNYSLYVGRRFNGNVNAPSVVTQGQSIVRYAATPYVGSTNNAGFAQLGTARLDFIATENMSNTNQGTRVLVSVTANGANTASNVVSFTSNGIVFESDGSIQNTAAIPLNYLGNALGVATLDAGGKVPTSQLPAGAVVYIGNWDAANNTPTLSNGNGTPGYEYSVSVGGTVDFGAGNITFSQGDFVIYTAGNTWEQIPGSASVTSFNGRTGVITLQASDVVSAQGYTSYNGNTNPNGYVNTVGAAAAAPVQNFNSRVGNVVLLSSDVTTALTNGALVNAKLANSNIIIGNTTATLGATVSSLAGLTSVTATNLTGTLQTPSQTNITSVGTLTNLNVAGISNLGSNANVIISGGSSGQALVTNGAGGLSFVNVQNIAGYVAQTVGSWTPTLIASGGGSFTYSVQAGEYVKSGQSVSCFFTISITNATGVSGTVRIGNLPTPSLNVTNSGGCGMDSYSFATMPSHITGTVAGGSSICDLYWHDRSGSNNTLALMTTGELGTTATMTGRITYISAS